MRALTLALIASSRIVLADTFPHWDVYWMSADAEAVVLGEQTKDDQFKVLKWLRSPKGLELPLHELEIEGLGKHSKKLNAFWSKVGKTDSKTLSTHRFVAFLERIEGSWQSIATIEESGLVGSCGLIWIQDGTCYRYTQAMNPGPYDLFEAKDNKTEKELMAEIEIGLADAKRWQQALDTIEKSARASALAAYAMTSSSPENPRSTYRFRVREPLRELGEIAVPALREQIARAKPSDSLNEVVLILYDIGENAQEAVPDLIKLLQDNKRANPYYVLSALRTTADAKVIPFIRPFLNHENVEVREEAAKAMSELEQTKTEHDGTGQPATRPELKSEGSQKPQLESDVLPR